MLYIVVPTYNRIDVCNQFISDLSKQTFQNYKLILVDHGKKKTGIVSSEKIEVIESNVNGWARAVNIGLNHILSISKSKDDYVLIINDDVRIEMDYIENIEQSILEMPNTVLGTCCIDKNTNLTLRIAIKLDKLRAKHIYNYYQVNLDEINNTFIESDVLTGKGTVFPLEILRNIGIYDDKRLPHYKSDHELVWRAKKNKYNVFTSKKMKLYTVSDQKQANRKESLKATFKFFMTDMTSIINIKDLWNYADLAYNKPYALYFFVMNFSRNILGMLIQYWRSQ